MKTPYKVVAIEWNVLVPGHVEPAAVIRRLTLQGVERFRAVTWAPTSSGRELIGYYNTGDEAAAAAWRRYVDESQTQHELASRMHGRRERGGPSA